MTPQPRSYLTAGQVADMLDVDKSTVHRWASSDATCPALRLGKVVRFELQALERWLASKTQRSRRPADL
jgi:excisionase family DNA binding protein